MFDSASPLAGLSQRLPPSNLAAEQALLGILLANNKWHELTPNLRPEHFFDPLHGRLYAAIAGRIEGKRKPMAAYRLDGFYGMLRSAW